MDDLRRTTRLFVVVLFLVVVVVPSLSPSFFTSSLAPCAHVCAGHNEPFSLPVGHPSPQVSVFRDVRSVVTNFGTENTSTSQMQLVRRVWECNADRAGHPQGSKQQTRPPATHHLKMCTRLINTWWAGSSGGVRCASHLVYLIPCMCIRT